MLPGGREFRIETWTLYAVGILVILLRLVARIRQGRFSAWHLDDWLTVSLIIWYTLLVVALNKVFFSGGSNFMTPEEEAALTPETTAARIEGSKWVLVVEEAMVLTVWTCKLGMLFLYRRITQGLKQAKIINLTFIWVGAGFVGTQLALFLNCRPFAEYWAVPTQKTQCWSYFNYQIVEACFNISSDLLMLSIAIPILFKLQAPLLQRVILLSIFGMGIFIIAAAILTKLYSLYPPLLTYAYLNWYCREASVCVYVTNLPAIWTLVLDVFPALRRRGWTSRNQSSEDRNNMSRASRANRGKNHSLQKFSRLDSSVGTSDAVPTESQEHIGGLYINKDTTFSVQRELTYDDDQTTSNPSLDKQEKMNNSHLSNCSAV